MITSASTSTEGTGRHWPSRRKATRWSHPNTMCKMAFDVIFNQTISLDLFIKTSWISAFPSGGVLSDTATEAQLGNQLMVGTVKQVSLEPLLQGWDLMSSDRQLQVLGSAKLKARDAMVFFVLGTVCAWGTFIVRAYIHQERTLSVCNWSNDETSAITNYLCRYFCLFFLYALI